MSASLDVDAYAQWAHDVWATAVDQPSDEKCRVIMGYGLFGECGEVMEVLENTPNSGAVDMVELRNEMGDVAYYWCRIVKSYGLTASDLWPKHSLLRPVASSLPEICLKLTARCGGVAEAMKKEVRDSRLDVKKLSTALAGVAEQWVHLARHYGLCVEDILESNRNKVNARYAGGANREGGYSL
jgi:NTP pyrophosphatase (non-canonical NTP hydrolase)